MRSIQGMGSKMKYMFVRNNNTNEDRKVVESNVSKYTIRGCFSTCSAEVRDRLESFFADREQESVKFTFSNGETVEVWRDV